MQSGAWRESPLQKIVTIKCIERIPADYRMEGGISPYASYGVTKFDEPGGRLIFNEF